MRISLKLYVYSSSVDKYFRSNEYSENLIQASMRNAAGRTAIEADGDERIIPGGDLYFNVKNFFRTYLETVLQVRELHISTNISLCYSIIRQ